MTGLSVVIPVYNEERAIADTVRQVKEKLAQFPSISFEIVCVNDGSTDRSREILQSISNIVFVDLPTNRGYGAALKAGLRRVKNEWILILDADGTYPLEELDKLIECIRPELDMVVGSRYGIGISSHPFKRLARWILRRLVFILTKRMVPDLNSGMRIFRTSLYDEFAHILPMGFSFTTTLTVASLYSGYQVDYVPITYNLRIGKSNIKPVRDFLGFTMLILRIATYFEPLSLFMRFAIGLFLIGAAFGIRDILVVHHIGSLAVLLMVSSVQVLATGMIADVVVRRSSHSPRPQVPRA